MRRRTLHRRMLVTLAAGVVLTAGLLGGTASPASASDDSDEWETVCRINEERVTHGREPLRVTPGLRSVARSWSDVMGAFQNLDHNPNLVSQVQSSVTPYWRRLGENVGAGFSVASLHGAFMASQGHRDNILDYDFQYIGVGVTHTGAHGQMWVTHDFLRSSVPLQTVSDPYHSFVDVCSNNPFFDEIEWMSDEGISDGYTDGTYRPTDVVTRQSMSAFMYRLAGSPGGSFPDPGFSDVPPTHPFHREISWMADSEVTTGYPEGTFRPTAHVTREAMSAFMYRLVTPTAGPYSNPGFSDVGPDHAFADEIFWMASSGVTTGFTDGTFRPGDSVTRQAMSAFMQRIEA
jgi:hypothetical protein